jgi:hypothetical protein
MMLGNRVTPVTFHYRVVSGDQLRHHHAFEFIPRTDTVQSDEHGAGLLVPRRRVFQPKRIDYLERNRVVPGLSRCCYGRSYGLAVGNPAASTYRHPSRQSPKSASRYPRSNAGGRPCYAARPNFYDHSVVSPNEDEPGNLNAARGRKSIILCGAAISLRYKKRQNVLPKVKNIADSTII